MYFDLETAWIIWVVFQVIGLTFILLLALRIGGAKRQIRNLRGDYSHLVEVLQTKLWK